jgi:hypothetical protein
MSLHPINGNYLKILGILLFTSSNFTEFYLIYRGIATVEYVSSSKM